MAELVEARMFGDVDEYNRRAIHKATCGDGPGHGIFHRSVRRAGRDACGLRFLRLAFLALLRGSVLPKPRRQQSGRQTTPVDNIFTHTPSLRSPRSEEHTSELQSRLHLVCRLLLEKKK